jgi:hypothetical protein
VKLSLPELHVLRKYKKLLSKVGINLMLEGNYVKILKISYILMEQNLYEFIPKLVQCLQDREKENNIQMTEWLIRGESRVYNGWNLQQAALLLTELDRLYPDLIALIPSNLVQVIMLEKTIEALNIKISYDSK